MNETRVHPSKHNGLHDGLGTPVAIRVWRKPGWLVLFDVVARLIGSLPFVLLGALPGALAGYVVSCRAGWSAWWMLAGALWVAPLAVGWALLALRQFGQRIELGADAVRFAGFVWWRPWYRVRRGVLTIPLGRIEVVETHHWLRGHHPWLSRSWRPLRLVGDGAIVDIPRLVPDRDELEHVLRAHASTSARQALGGTHPHTERRLQRIIVILAAVGYAIAMLTVIVWIAAGF